MWILTLIILTTLFTIALTSKYKEDILDLRRDLLDQRAKYENMLLEVHSDYNEEIAKLVDTINKIRN